VKLGLMSALFGDRPLDRALADCRDAGLEAIELPAGGYPGRPFFDPAEVLATPDLQRDIRARLRDAGLTLSGLAVHGNPVHPDPEHARRDHDAFATAVALAPALGTDVVVTFSGCPGGAPGDRTPNWVTCAWPDDYRRIFAYQWDEVLVPYWAAQARLARDHGVRIAWEPHPGFAVYNPDTLVRLSEAATRAAGLDGPTPLGANLDPSHLFWQGVDPVLAARRLAEAGLLFHVHAKDTRLDPDQGPLNGYLDARPYDDLSNRSWTFRACGDGHGDEFWRPFVTTLRAAGYDGPLSIEHEDPTCSVEEGLARAVAYLRRVTAER
jgi:sugar phosphate isomerase/epimerase